MEQDTNKITTWTVDGDVWTAVADEAPPTQTGTVIPRWYSTYQLECDRCGQTYGESSVSADAAAERHERRCGGDVWAASLAFPYALPWGTPTHELDAHTARHTVEANRA